MKDLRPLRQAILGLEFSPVSKAHPRNWLFRTKRSLDFIGHARRPMSSFFRRINPYPKPFEHHTLLTEDRIQIAAWYGPPHGDAPAPFGLVIVPGMFSTKDDTVHKRRAIRIWRGWKIPVICIDTRAFGESNGISTGGWKEAMDVQAAAKFLAEKAGVERVAVMAESLGGASALNALALDHEAGTDLLTGGVLCWSAFMDLADAVDYISSKPPRDHPFYAQWLAFRKLLSFRTHGGYERFDEYMEDAARVNGLETFQDLVDIANPKWKTSMMKQPALLIHATDDQVVPVRHARRMERYAIDHPHIQVITVPFGAHTGFEAMDPWWYWEVVRRFFGTVNGVTLANLADPNPFNQGRRGNPKE